MIMVIRSALSYSTCKLAKMKRAAQIYFLLLGLIFVCIYANKVDNNWYIINPSSLTDANFTCLEDKTGRPCEWAYETSGAALQNSSFPVEFHEIIDWLFFPEVLDGDVSYTITKSFLGSGNYSNHVGEMVLEYYCESDCCLLGFSKGRSEDEEDEFFEILEPSQHSIWSYAESHFDIEPFDEIVKVGFKILSGNGHCYGVFHRLILILTPKPTTSTPTTTITTSSTTSPSQPTPTSTIGTSSTTSTSPSQPTTTSTTKTSSTTEPTLPTTEIPSTVEQTSTTDETTPTTQETSESELTTTKAPSTTLATSEPTTTKEPNTTTTIQQSTTTTIQQSTTQQSTVTTDRASLLKNVPHLTLITILIIMQQFIKF